MATVKAKVAANTPLGLFDNRDAKDVISETHTAELVIALCGPIGTPLHDVADTLKELLEIEYKYDFVTKIRLSEFITDHASRAGNPIPEKPESKKINGQIDRGDELRKQHGRSILAELAVAKISVDRHKFKNQAQSERHLPRRICHIIDSIKNEEELNLLRLVYQDMVYAIGVYAPLSARESNLTKRGLLPGEVYQLIDRDSGEEIGEGQTVRNTFPRCDFFLRLDSGTDTQLKLRVKRFLNLILGYGVVTPTPHESAMYAAASAAVNSACLSRQVGAAITTKDERLIAVGWNDVPKAGGDLYVTNSRNENPEKDQRCWNHVGGGKCSNDEEKETITEIILADLIDIIPINSYEQAKKIIRNSTRLSGLVEFSRSIHAEMHALLNAGKAGLDNVVGGKLFVTTYPCHSCARHIIASGIMEVYYIEPYRKSLAIRLHGDAITESESEIYKVQLRPYEGVAPAKYLSLFRMANSNERKEKGKMVKLHPSKTEPKMETSLEALPALEALVVSSLQQKGLLPGGELK